jgi:hypothetical protein
LHFFLGIEVKRCPSGLVLTQEKYIADLLTSWNVTLYRMSNSSIHYGKNFIDSWSCSWSLQKHCGCITVFDTNTS